MLVRTFSAVAALLALTPAHVFIHLYLYVGNWKMFGLLAAQTQQLSWEQLSSCVEGHTHECQFNNGRKATISFGKCSAIYARLFPACLFVIPSLSSSLQVLT